MPNEFYNAPLQYSVVHESSIRVHACVRPGGDCMVALKISLPKLILYVFQLTDDFLYDCYVLFFDGANEYQERDERYAKEYSTFELIPYLLALVSRRLPMAYSIPFSSFAAAFTCSVLFEQ